MAAVCAGSTILGMSAIFVKWAIAGGASPLTVGAYRMVLSLPALWWLARREGRLGAGAGRAWALLAGVCFFLDVWGWHSAMRLTSAANATFITAGLCPLWVASFSVLVWRRRYRWLGWLGQALGLSGALILAFAKGARVGDGRGELLALVASLGYASFTLTLGQSRRTLQARQALFWFSLSAGACFTLASLVAGDALLGYSALAWLSLLGLGVGMHVLSWLLNSWGLGHVDTAFGALGLQMQQVATLFLAAWLLAEPIRGLGVLGGVLIVGGIVAVAFSPQR